MTRRLLLVALVLLALGSAAAAQEKPPLVRLYEDLVTLARQGDFEALAQRVAEDPRNSVRLFDFLEGVLESDPSARDERLLLNLVARVFLVRLQRTDLSLRLHAAGRLEPESAWAGTPLADRKGLQDLLAQAEALAAEWQAYARDLRLHTERSDFAAALEDYATVFLLASAFERDVLARAPALVERTRRLREGVRARDLDVPGGDAVEELARVVGSELEVVRVLEVARLGELGLFTEAARRGEALLPTTGVPRFLRLALLGIARRAGMPDLARRARQGLQGDTPQERFYLASVDFEDELYRNPAMTPTELRQRQAAAWADRPPALTRPMRDAVRIWALAAADQPDVLEAILAEVADTPPYLLLEIRLDLAAHARESGDAARAARELARAEALLPELERALPALRAREEELFAGASLRPDLLRGILSRLPGRVQEERARQGETPAFAAALRLYERAGAAVPLLLLRPTAALARGSFAEAERAVREAEASGHRGALALALMARGRLRGDPGDLARGARLLEDVLTQTGGRTAENLRLRREAEPAYALLARLQASAGRTEEAFATLAALGLVQGQDLPVPAAGPVEALRARLASLEGEAITLERLPPAPGVEDLRARTAELLASTRAEFEAALARLHRDQPAYRRLALRPVAALEIQERLPADAALVQYLPTAEGTFVFVVRRDAVRLRRLDVAEVEIREAVTEFRARMAGYVQAVEAGSAAPWNPRGGDAFPALLARLHTWLVEPLEPDLQGRQVLAVMPTGDLAWLPFGALGRLRPDGDLEFLAERRQVVTLLKASDLLHLADAEGPAGPVAALGDPDGSLQGAAQEVRALQDLFPGARVFVGEAASYEHLCEVAPEVGYLHLATHGVLDPRPDGNHLVLAGLPEGRLTTSHIAALHLGRGARLVTLSGCETAIRGHRPDSEALQSVADAFGFAGSPAVLASLWRVSDGSTLDLMVSLYGSLRDGSGRAAALQSAQRAMLADPARRHPFHWAPFVLIGDWR